MEIRTKPVVVLIVVPVVVLPVVVDCELVGDAVVVDTDDVVGPEKCGNAIHKSHDVPTVKHKNSMSIRLRSLEQVRRTTLTLGY